MKKIWILAALCCVIMAGCNEEEKLSPTEGPEDIYGPYTLPQGEHDYDSRIVAMYQKYNTLVLYKFKDRDFFWSNGYDIRWRYIPMQRQTTSGYDATPANEAHVGRQLDLLEKCFLNYFPDTLLRRTLPFKILLTDTICYLPGGAGMPDSTKMKYPEVSEAYDYIAIARGNQTNRTMTVAEIKAFKQALCSLFMKRCVSAEKMQISPRFAEATVYSTAINNSNMYSYGIFKSGVKTLAADWDAYVETIISTPLATMEATGGILHPNVDKAGKVRNKYDIIIAYFKTSYNIDLQYIGDNIPFN